MILSSPGSADVWSSAFSTSILISRPTRCNRAFSQKEIRLTLAAAEDLRVPMPIASLLRDRFLTLMAHGGDKLDWSAIGQLAAKDAGEVGA